MLVGVADTESDIDRHLADKLPPAASIAHENEALGYAAVSFPDDPTGRAREQFIEAVQKYESVRYAEPNRQIQIQYTPNDTLMGDQFAADMVHAPKAWDITQGDSAVTIAFVDTGIEYTHPDLSPSMDDSVTNHGYDFVGDTSDPYPKDANEEFHGTHVAGLAAAATDNGEGIAGITNSSVLCCRVADKDGKAYNSDIADAIEWATNHDADIVNLSLGGDTDSSVLADAVSFAYDSGVLLVAAAGNSSGDSVDYPAAYDECVAVSALDTDGQFAGYSNTGSDVELTAPGSNLLSTVTQEGYGRYSGTSMAAPIVSGVAALVLSRWPSLTHEELRTHLRETAVDIGLAAHKQGYGRVDAYGAVSTAPESVPDVTVIDDFEDGDLAEYDVDQGTGHGVVSSPARGTGALELAGDVTEIASTGGLATYPQAGDTFTVRFRTNGTGGGEQANFSWGVQDHQNRYYVSLNPGQQTMRLFIYDGGQSMSLSNEINASFSANAWHLLEVDWLTDGTQVVTLYAEDGSTQLAQVSGTDTTWTGGGIGFDAYLSSGEAVYFDDVRRQTTSSDGNIVDDFEDGDLAEYDVDQGTGHGVVSSPAYGSHSLELAGDVTEIASTGGLATYPQAGDTFSVRFRTNGTGGGEQANFSWGVQDHQNRYYVSLNPGQQTMRLFVYDGGNSTTLSSEASAAFSADAWHLLEVDWLTDGTQVVTLYAEDGSTQLAQVSGTDTTWTGGGIGFDAYLSSGEAVYFDECKLEVAGDGVSLIDGFEDGSLSEYTAVDASNWSIDATRAYSGTYAAVNSSDGDTIYTDSYTFERGDTLEARAYLGTKNGVASGLEFWFCTNADSSQKYVQYVSAENNNHYIVHRNCGNQTVVASDTSAAIPADEWLRLEIDTTSTIIEAKVYDSTGTLVSSLSGNDSSLSSGGYGFRDEWQVEDSLVFVDDIAGP